MLCCNISLHLKHTSEGLIQELQLQKNVLKYPSGVQQCLYNLVIELLALATNNMYFKLWIRWLFCLASLLHIFIHSEMW